MTPATSIRSASGPPQTRQSLWALLSRAVALRAGIVALILGSMLTIINQFGALFGDDTIALLPLVLVYVTPFAVVTLSQLLGMRRALRDARRGQEAVRFITTALSRGLLRSALALGLLIGSVNTSIVAAAAYAEHGHLETLPAALIAQAFVLPVVFGVLSQAISYRRAAGALASSTQAS